MTCWQVQNGLFPGRAPFGYRNVRVGGRWLIEVDPVGAAKVKRIFELYAFHHQTCDDVAQTLRREGIAYTDHQPGWTRSKVHTILRDRSYIWMTRRSGAGSSTFCARRRGTGRKRRKRTWGTCSAGSDR